MAEDKPHFALSGVVTVVVGLRNYACHRDLLEASSPFCAAKLKDCWNEGKNEIHLDDQEPAAAEIWIDWMYKNFLSRAPLSIDTETLRIGLIAKTYKLADYLIIPDLKNDLMDLIMDQHKKSRKWFTLHALIDLWEVDESDSGLFKYVFRSSILSFMTSPKFYLTGSGELKKISTRADTTLLLKVIEGIMVWNVKSWDLPSDDKKCDYHDHSEGSSCKEWDGPRDKVNNQ
ncbi:Transmembrane emp24 domain-containing protein 10 [Neophaeococcomyces mojaviensis]|uniref:Transmembrane emp24 domain-containing protein 10 n=1 Tax=Neophaeococcomyces mojaviensis TaxID=3383035 RepID=A0ACC3AIM0_9EURO|nr:Transmembrane emp24 domain-containing protein 10 [Knufia sp. JES_112]